MPIEQSQDNSIKQLTARHEAMLLRLVGGCQAQDVCLEFGITASRLSILRSSPLWREAEQQLRGVVRKSHQLRLESLTGKAIAALDSTVDDPDPRVRLGSAKEILNRTGFAESLRVEGESQTIINLYVPKNWQSIEEVAEQRNAD